MPKLTGIELKRARLVPSSVFASPGAVVRSEVLSRAQKIEILRRWEFDVRRGGAIMVAASAASDSMLDQVRRALMALGAGPARRSMRATQH